MSKRTPTTPGYCLHRASGQAIVRLSGRDYYLGKHDSRESRERYGQLVAGWLDGGRSALNLDRYVGLTIAELVEAFDCWARERYPDAPNGGQRRNILDALRPVVELHGRTELDRFGPMELRAVRQRMIDGGKLARRTINTRINLIRFVVKWAVGRSLLSPDKHAALVAVEPLRRGQPGLRETPRVLPVSQAVVDATLPFLSPIVADMVRVQLRTACRPGEVVLLHSADIDRSSDVWLFTPRKHKLEHHDVERVIPIGPHAQEIVAPRLAPGRWVFPTRTGTPYTTMSYGLAVTRACERAGVQPWSPNRLRHSGLTLYREAAGLEAAQAVAGHSKIETTQIYAERLKQRGIDAARAIG